MARFRSMVWLLGFPSCCPFQSRSGRFVPLIISPLRLLHHSSTGAINFDQRRLPAPVPAYVAPFFPTLTIPPRLRTFLPQLLPSLLLMRANPDYIGVLDEYKPSLFTVPL